MTADGSPRRGRRSGHSTTRDSILEAAWYLFADRGYSGATVRGIAARAGVDPALIAHFFVDKGGLFAAISGTAVQIPAALLEALDPPPGDAGARLAMAYLSLWENPDTAEPLLATARSALADEEAMERLRGLLLSQAPRDLKPFLAQDSPELRMVLVMSHLHGVAMARHVIKVPALATLSLEELVPAVAPAIQRYLTGPLLESAGTASVR